MPAGEDRPAAVLLLGPTGSGKTPLGELMEARGLWGTACRHFDFGANLRTVVAQDGPDELFRGAELRFLREVLDQGALLEDEHFWIAERILRDFLARQVAGSTARVVLNGLPRHVGQARAVDAIVRVEVVIRLECEAATVLRRIESNAGGDRSARVDDDRASVEKKLELFRRRTEPLSQHYRTAGIPIESIPVGPASAPLEVWRLVERRTPV